MAAITLTTFESWYDDVVPYVASCPLPIVKAKIRAAAIEFCKLSLAWRFHRTLKLSTVINVQDYDIAQLGVYDTGAGAGSLFGQIVVVHVFQVNYNDESLGFLTPAQFRSRSDTWSSDVGTPDVFTMFEEGVISLGDIPEASTADAIKFTELALAPSQIADGVDSGIFQRYREVIAKGARSRLHLMPKKPYTDVNLGMALQQEFIAAAGVAGARAATGGGHARLRSKTIIR